MALSEFETKRFEKLVREFVEKRRPPAPLRKELDLQFRIEGQSVEIFEVRPLWTNPEESVEASVAKATFVKSTGVWKVYWKRADLKWHRYAPQPVVESLEAFLSLVDKDDHCCFFG